MLKYKVLANQLTSLADARYFASQGATWLSFLLTPGHQATISSTDLLEIKNWIEGPGIIGQFIQPTRQEVIDAIKQYQLDAVILDEDTPLDMIQHGFSVPIFREITLSKDSDWATSLEWAAPFVDSFILKIPTDIINDAQNQKFINELCEMYDIFLEDEKQASLMPQAIEQFKPAGLVAKATATETVVGIKSFDELESFFDYLQNEH